MARGSVHFARAFLCDSRNYGVTDKIHSVCADFLWMKPCRLLRLPLRSAIHTEASMAAKSPVAAVKQVENRLEHEEKCKANGVTPETDPVQKHYRVNNLLLFFMQWSRGLHIFRKNYFCLIRGFYENEGHSTCNFRLPLLSTQLILSHVIDLFLILVCFLFSKSMYSYWSLVTCRDLKY
jgi:hypothetical protein